jgi:hypothetical protein
VEDSRTQLLRAGTKQITGPLMPRSLGVEKEKCRRRRNLINFNSESVQSSSCPLVVSYGGDPGLQYRACERAPGLGLQSLRPELTSSHWIRVVVHAYPIRLPSTGT